MLNTCTLLRTLRKYKGATQQEAADFLNIERSTYTKMENSKAPNLRVDIIEKITQFYGLEDERYTLLCLQHEQVLLSDTTARLITLKVCKEKQLKGFSFWRAILSQKPITLYL